MKVITKLILKNFTANEFAAFSNYFWVSSEFSYEHFIATIKNLKKKIVQWINIFNFSFSYQMNWHEIRWFWYVIFSEYVWIFFEFFYDSEIPIS